MWALGVVLYWLLTGTYPFDEADELAQQDAVLTQSPEPPHVRNPRVPRVLGELCLRMLEKAPEARLPTAEALEATLKQVLEAADAAWDVPLGEPDDGEEESPAEDAPPGRERPRRPPRRGMTPPPEESNMLRPPTKDAPRPPRGAPPWWVVWALVGLALVLAAWALLAATRAPSPPVPIPSPVPDELYPPEGLEAPGQEVAPVCEAPEGGRGAAPEAAAIPAPVATATPAKDIPMRTPHQAPTAQDAKHQEKQKSLPGSAAGTCVILWAVGQLACTGPGAQVRPLTPADCPPDAQKAMEEWGISSEARASLPVVGDAQPVTVRQGPGASVWLVSRYWGEAPIRTVFTGELVFGKERVYGRFTEARTPDGKWFPVCVQLVDNDGQLGLIIRSRPGPDTAVVFSTQTVQAVRDDDWRRQKGDEP